MSKANIAVLIDRSAEHAF